MMISVFLLSCPAQVSNGVLLDEYKHNLAAALGHKLEENENVE